MSIFAKSIARLAAERKGQFILSLPDDVPVTLAKEILTEANKLINSEPAYAVAAYEHRSELAGAGPAYVFRELAEIRQGSHLVVVYASDFKTLATFKKVYPSLFSAGFPGDDFEDGAARGLVGLDDVVGAICRVLNDSIGAHIAPSKLYDTVRFILAFLADAYSAEGNTASGWSARWWVHVSSWLSSIEAALGSQSAAWKGLDAVARMFGAAGLPRPDRGESYRRGAAELYARIIQERWANPDQIASELDRMEYVAGSTDVVAGLRSLPWAGRLLLDYETTESRVAAVFSVSRLVADELRWSAWANLPEEIFFSNPVAAAELLLCRGNVDLQRPWPDAAFFLPVERKDLIGGQVARIRIADLQVVVPVGAASNDENSRDAIDPSQLQLKFSGVVSSNISFSKVEWSTSKFTAYVSVDLEFKKRPFGPVSVTLTAMGRAAKALGERAMSKLCFAYPDDAVLCVGPAVQPNGKPRKAAVVYRWLEDDSDITEVELRASGTRQLAVYLGSDRAASISEVLISPSRAGVAFARSEADLRLFVCLVCSIDSGDVVQLSPDSGFQFDIADSKIRPISPLVAACEGVRPSVDQRLDIYTSVLGEFETELLDVLRRMDDSGKPAELGQIAVTSGIARSPLSRHESGLAISAALIPSFRSRIPHVPDSTYAERQTYRRLVDAYCELRIPELVGKAEQVEQASGLIPSRVSLLEVSRGQVDQLLKAYAEHIEDVDSNGSEGERFWARFPMSVVIYSEQPGMPTCEAVLLSCLHPIRLAWRWELETAFACVNEETGRAPSVARLTEGWTFPAIAAIRNAFASGETPLVSMPIDSGSDQVFVGWSALVPVRGDGMPEEPRAPEFVNGHRFPSGASSGLSDTAVAGAIREFVRVFPQVRTLSIDLPVPQRTTRAIGIDRSIGHALEAVAGAADEWVLPGGIRIRDSAWRLGPPPAADRLIPRGPTGRPLRKFEWEIYDPTGNRCDVPVNVRLVQSQTSLVAAARVGNGRAAMPRVPMRRFPTRSRSAGTVVVDYSMDQSRISTSPFLRALSRLEDWSEGKSLAVSISTGTALQGIQNADWTVTGDAGLDPASLQSFIADQGGRHMLWEWRPAVALGSRTADFAIEQRPYVTISRLPKAFSSSLQAKIRALIPDLDVARPEDCVNKVVRLLAQRGIGLNSLLAMGHHNSTGALGFFFAFSMLDRWCRVAPIGSIRCLVPVDAVHGLLRTVLDAAVSEPSPQRLADILAIEAISTEGGVRLKLIPIEVKHYGLVEEEQGSGFPVAAEPKLLEHLDQLKQYSRFMEAIKAARESVSDTHRCLIDTAIGAVLDAAQLLDPNLAAGEKPFLLRAVADGEFELEICPVLLMWFQKDGSIERPSPVEMECLGESEGGAHAEIFVDPVRCFDELWLGNGTEGLSSLIEALDWCQTYISIDAGGSNPPTKADSEPVVEQDWPPQVIDEHTLSAESHDKLDATAAIVEVEGKSADSAEIGRQEKRPAVSHPRGLTDQELRRRYTQLLNTFHEYRLAVESPSEKERYSEGPASIVFSVLPGRGVPTTRIESRLNDLKLRLSLESDQNIGFSIDRGMVRLDVPKPDSERYFVDASDMWARWHRPQSGFQIPFGEDRGGQIVSVDFANPNSPHLLIAGTTGSGKSEALLTILRGAEHFYTSHDLKFLLVDPKGTELRPFEKSEYLLGKIGWTDADAIALLDRGISEMERRYEAFRKSANQARDISSFNEGRSDEERLPRWLMVLDEYADLTSDAKEKTKIEDRLKRLAQKARAAGIHLIICTQKPVVTVINTVVRGNLPAQLALRTRSAMESQIIMEERGAETLTGKGDAFLKVGGKMIRVQCAKC